MTERIFPRALIACMSDGHEPSMAEIEAMAHHIRRDLTACGADRRMVDNRTVGADDERLIQVMALFSLRGAGSYGRGL